MVEKGQDRTDGQGSDGQGEAKQSERSDAERQARLAAYREAVETCLRNAEAVTDPALKLQWALRAAEWEDEVAALQWFGEPKPKK